MPNASTEVGGFRSEQGREVRGGGEGRHKNLFCFFVPTVAFQRYQIAGPPRLSGWSQIAFGTVRGAFCGEPRFCFLRRRRRAVPSHRLPLRVFFTRMYACVGTRTTRKG